MHAAVYAYIYRTARLVAPRRRIVNLGGRNVNGSLRGLFKDAERYVSVDLVAGPDVDIVADAATFRPDFAPDLVICTEVLEHTPLAERIVTNAHDILAPGGVLILTTAWLGRGPHSADGGPLKPWEYYANISQYELVRWLRPFAQMHLETDAKERDIRATGWKGPL